MALVSQDGFEAIGAIHKMSVISGKESECRNRAQVGILAKKH
jgi:hypothetical protein